MNVSSENNLTFVKFVINYTKSKFIQLSTYRRNHTLKDHKNKILLSPSELAARWKVTLCTLSQWRWNGNGPNYIKVGKSILYDLAVIEDYENERIRQNTSQKVIS